MIAERIALGRDLVAASYLKGDFILRSGKRSNRYFDKFLFETDPALLRRLSELGIGFKDLQTQQSSLEDIFVSLVSERT